MRNPAVLAHPLDATAAASVIARYRKHPRWKTLGFPPRSRELHDELWKQAATRDFATLNVKDFQNLGFKKVWNPLAME